MFKNLWQKRITNDMEQMCNVDIMFVSQSKTYWVT